MSKLVIKAPDADTPKISAGADVDKEWLGVQLCKLLVCFWKH